MKKKILVALSTFGEYGKDPLKLLEENGFTFSINRLGRRLVQEEIIQMGKDCEGIIAGVEPYDDYVLENLPKLRCISRCGVGIDNISSKKAKEKGIEIRNTVDVVIQPVAELTVGMVFDLLKKISYHNMLLKNKKWQREIGYLLAGKNVGILGLGKIGKRVAEMMTNLSVKVYGADILPDRKWAKENKIQIVSNEELLKISDILSIHLSSLENHPFQLGEKEIAKMKKGAFVVNVSRGKLIDEEALYAALRNGHLAGAALDVFTEEPYQGKLCELENVVLTPHIATFTKESRLQMEIEATKNLIDFFTHCE